MIDLIKKLMGAAAACGAADTTDEDVRGAPRDVHLAACAVFLEMARIDNEFDEREQEHIVNVFHKEYGLAAEDVVELKKASAHELEKAPGHWTFTNVINQNYSNEEKSRLVELLWQLVYADGRMDEHENYFMHKLAKLLRLTHRDLIDAKLKVLHGMPPPERD
jgi:uncharacterized tellurite resistance protein B-like protein